MNGHPASERHVVAVEQPLRVVVKRPRRPLLRRRLLRRCGGLQPSGHPVAEDAPGDDQEEEGAAVQADDEVRPHPDMRKGRLSH